MHDSLQTGQVCNLYYTTVGIERKAQKGMAISGQQLVGARVKLPSIYLPQQRRNQQPNPVRQQRFADAHYRHLGAVL
jgi:hypothetical protein